MDASVANQGAIRGTRHSIRRPTVSAVEKLRAMVQHLGGFVMNVTKSIALLAAALLSTAAIADDKSMKSADQKFDSLDRNKDSAISKTEASKDEMLTVKFASVDTDGDGYVSKAEYTAKLSDRSSQQPTDR
jgi:hypothetical protein